MAARRAERLVNLVICLLSTRQFLGAERIRDAVPGYEAADGARATDDAFKRMFERDKAELRDLGIPLETGRNSHFDSEDGYRIRRGDYELPTIEFDADEAAAVGLAARLWQSATLGEPARQALIKLRAAGTEVRTADAPGAMPQLDASDPSLPSLLDAARTATVVRFDYVKAGADAALERTLEPWGVLSWRRRWYVAGFDRDRGEPRSFRLSRIAGAVRTVGAPDAFTRPEHVDLLGLVAGRNPEDGRTARVRVSGHGAGQLRRLAQREAGDVLSIGYTDTEWLARLIAAAGAGAHVLEPDDLAAAVVGRLRAVTGVR
ncbi:transcriptional regulator [Jatrophihabitans endophyticus]|uniref:Transcriptional regulator n=1 Tax=Jatrophihabitans endophyticus TaxID=1206085 RepID=A0A1M5MV15_9ACTN|nr:WYL domain-containing protein [Jatrophihabitans endophyticus]SHG80739.1 transcriptional regulator [Jatrophihabitans endophyticus]